MKVLRTAAAVAVLTALPVISFAQSTASPSHQSTAAPSKAKPAAKPVTTTMTGVVKSVGDTSLVVTRTNAKGPEETFQLNSSTMHKGKAKLVAGDTVSVRYYLDNGQKVATMVTVTKAPAKAGKK
jgi:uncharacterized protein DUF5666